MSCCLIPTLTVRNKNYSRTSVHSHAVKIIPHPQEIYKLKYQRRANSRPVVNKWYDWIANYAPKPTRTAVNKVFLKVKNNILGLSYSAKTIDGIRGEGSQKRKSIADRRLSQFKTSGTQVDYYYWLY